MSFVINMIYNLEICKTAFRHVGIEKSYFSLGLDYYLSDSKDYIAMGGIADTSSRRKLFLISNPVKTFGKVALVRCSDIYKYNTLAKINRLSIRVVENIGGTNMKFAKKKLPNSKLILVMENELAFKFLLEHKADVMITDSIEANYKHKTIPALCVANPYHPFTKENMVYLLPKNNYLLLYVVNKWLRSIKS